MKLDSALNLEAKDASKNIENSGKSHFLRPNYDFYKDNFDLRNFWVATATA